MQAALSGVTPLTPTGVCPHQGKGLEFSALCWQPGDAASTAFRADLAPFCLQIAELENVNWDLLGQMSQPRAVNVEFSAYLSLAEMPFSPLVG